MGLDVETHLWDYLQQTFFMVLAGVVFFLVITRADPDAFFLQYHAKDAGLTIETLHAARGSVEMASSKTMDGIAFDYDVTKNGILLRKAGTNEWTVRKRYGMDRSPDGVAVQESLLLNPELFLFQRGSEDGKDRIMVTETYVASSACAVQGERPAKRETSVRVDGSSPLLGNQLRLLATTFAAVRPQTTILLFVIEEEGPARLLVTGNEPRLAGSVSCSLARKLPELELVPAPVSAPSESVVITILHNATLPPGLTESRVSAALLQTLEVTLR